MGQIDYGYHMFIHSVIVKSVNDDIFIFICHMAVLLQHVGWLLRLYDILVRSTSLVVGHLGPFL